MEIDNLDMNNFSTAKLMERAMHKSITEKLDAVLIEGLKRKGFEFAHKAELIEFVKSNCRCENRTYNERVYYVNDIPFLFHKDKPEMNFDINEAPGTLSMKATVGEFCYL
jgi:hypothetical protein